MQLGPLAVQIVGGSWIDSVLPVTAILVSVGTFAWTVFDRRRDRAHLKVTCAWSLPVGEVEFPEALSLTATNVGHVGSTVVSMFVLALPKKRGQLVPMPWLGRDPELPRTLAPGQSVQMFVNPRAVAATCAERGIDPRDLTPVAQTGHGPARGKMARSAISALQRAIWEVKTAG